MEEITTSTPAKIEEQLHELAPLNVIRTETVISKLPIHNLAKKGNISIHITQRNPKGEVTLNWEVSPNPKYGVPRQLAYKLDTLVVNRCIDEAGKPLPKLVRLGSLREIAQALGMELGGNCTDRIKNALYQNAFAAITAKLSYEANDRSHRTLEAGFTRYSVIFTGQKLPDGSKADAVYLILNDPYRDVLNNAPFRPLNYDYLRELAPAPQRFYEIVSRQIFAALKYQRAEAKLRYSEFCTYSAGQRYPDYDRFKKQMYKIHRPHLASGYLKSVRYQATTDDAGEPDWIMYYTPGPKAKAEYHTFARSGRVLDTAPDVAADAVELAPVVPRRRRTTPRQAHLPFAAPTAKDTAAEEPIQAAVRELIRRGVSERKAHALAKNIDDQDLILDQLDWGDHLIRQSPQNFRNTPGFYIYLVSERVTPPDSFETSRQRKLREATEEEHARRRKAEIALEESYQSYRRRAIDRHIAAHLRSDDLERLIADKVRERRQDGWCRNLPTGTVREIAEREVRQVIGDQVPVMSFEEFKRANQGREGD